MGLVIETLPRPLFGGESCSNYDQVLQEFLDCGALSARVDLPVHEVTSYIELCRSIEARELYDQVLVMTARKALYLVRLAGEGASNGPVA